MQGSRRRLPGKAALAVLLPVLLGLGSSPAWSADLGLTDRTPSGVVFILNSYHPGFFWSDAEQATIVQALKVEKRDALPVIEYLDAKRMPNGEHVEEVRKLFLKKYAGKRFSIVVAVDDPALAFAVRYGSELFGGGPVVFCGVSNYSPSLLGGRSNVTGIVDTSDPTGTIEVMLRLHPHARQILVLHDYTAAGLAIRHDFEAVMPGFAGRVQFSFPDNMPIEDLLAGLERLPDGTLVLLLSYSVDGTGRVFDTRELTEEISAHSRVPLYAHAELRLDHGIVGGKLLSPGVVASEAMTLVRRILDGEDARSIPVLMMNTSRYMFDYRQMARFNIPMSALPAGSRVINVPVSFFRLHRDVLLYAAGVVLLLAVVISLVVRSNLRHRHSEKARRLGELRVRGILDSIPDLAWLKDRDLRFAAVNPAFCRFHGRAAEDFIGRTHEQVLPSALDERFRREDQETVRSGIPLRVEENISGGGGQARWFDTVKAPLRDLDGSLVGIVGVSRDITERRQAEEANRINEARMESLLRISQRDSADIRQLLDFALREAIALTASRIGFIYRYDEHRREFSRVAWSPEVMKECSIVEKHTRYPLEQAGLWGEAVRQRRPIVVNDYLASHPLKRGVPEGHVSLSRFMTIPVTSGESLEAVIVVANKASEYDEADVRQLTLLMDSVWKIVERRRAEEERAKLEEQLRQAQKMEPIGRLAAGVAHDINNLLSPILGYTELLLDEFPTGDRRKDDLEQIAKAAARVRDLTRQLLAFGRKQLLSLKPVDLRVVVEEFAKLLRRTIREDIRIETQLPESLGIVRADTGQIEQVLMNLAVNAQDAMPGGGVLTVALRDEYLDETFAAAHRGTSPGSHVVLSVSDSGIGMGRETRERLFEPFFTTKNRGEGTGLGLSTVFGIVSQHGGSIGVETEPGRGSTFQIFLPRVEEAPGTALVGPGAVRESRRGVETILVVEDMPAVRMLAVTVLERQGYRVFSAASGEHALEIFERERQTVDLLLTDVVMPGMNGEQLYRRLAGMRPGLRVLFMSAYAGSVIAHHGVLDEGLAFIQKPFTVEGLGRKVREVLDERRSAEGAPIPQVPAGAATSGR